jgi:hypothetical protein
MADGSEPSYPGYVPPPEASPSQPAEEVPLEVIRLDDILSVPEVRRQREAADNAILQQIANPNLGDIRNRLVEWATGGFVGDCTLFSISIEAPDVCSDGVTRSLADYIRFVSGKTIQEHTDLLRIRLPDFVVSFVWLGSVIQFRASRG